MKPDFIGIGTQKRATARLYNMLADHPQINMEKQTECMKN